MAKSNGRYNEDAGTDEFMESETEQDVACNACISDELHSENGIDIPGRT